jgi:hypothetical protein
VAGLEDLTLKSYYLQGVLDAEAILKADRRRHDG